MAGGAGRMGAPLVAVAARMEGGAVEGVEAMEQAAAVLAILATAVLLWAAHLEAKATTHLVAAEAPAHLEVATLLEGAETLFRTNHNSFNNKIAGRTRILAGKGQTSVGIGNKLAFASMEIDANFRITFSKAMAKIVNFTMVVPLDQGLTALEAPMLLARKIKAREAALLAV